VFAQFPAACDLILLWKPAAAAEAARKRVLDTPIMSEAQARIQRTSGPVSPALAVPSWYSIFDRGSSYHTSGESKGDAVAATPVVVDQLPAPTPIRVSRQLFSPADIGRPSTLVKGAIQCLHLHEPLNSVL
jgi:hypothetical protein